MAALKSGHIARVCRKASRHLKSCPKIILIHSHSVQVPKKNASDQAVTMGGVSATVGLTNYLL
jgi:hypothetical protein